MHIQNLSSESINFDERRLHEVVLVTKDGRTTMNLREKYSTERGCKKEETRLKSEREIDRRRRYCK